MKGIKKMKQFTISQKIYMGVKRVIDILLSALALILLSWLFLILCIAIKIDSRGPILFKQKRVGIHKTHFMIYKFRTMRIDTPKDMPTHMLADPEQYITRVGKFLRKSSLDELPQFINVFKGEMSVVGPRPHMLSHTEIYARLIDKYMVRHFIKPGVTGWAQIHGFRGETKELSQMGGRVKADIWYMEHWTIFLDLYIIYKTIANVVIGEKNAY